MFWDSYKFGSLVAGLVRTWVTNRWVQQVHGSSAQAQSVHPVRGLFEIRHHARSTEGETGVWTDRKVQICRCSGAQVPGVKVASCGKKKHSK